MNEIRSNQIRFDSDQFDSSIFTSIRDWELENDDDGEEEEVKTGKFSKVEVRRLRRDGEYNNRTTKIIIILTDNSILLLRYQYMISTLAC